MHLLSSSFLLAASLPHLVSSAPVNAHLPHKREIGGVLICQGVNATGPCTYSQYALETCHDMPAGFSQNAATFAPDGEDFYCYPRVGSCTDICTSPTGCTFGPVSFDSPVKYDLTSINWQNLTESFDCHLNQTGTGQ